MRYFYRLIKELVWKNVKCIMLMRIWKDTTVSVVLLPILTD